MGIRIVDPLHRPGENLPLSNWPLVHAAAWWIAAELVRRHPGELRVYDTGSHFQYDVLAVSKMSRNKPTSGSSAVVWMNRHSQGHLTTGSWFDDPSSTERFNWIDVLMAPNRLTYIIEQLEREAGLTSPKTSPTTKPNTIVPRIIAGFLARAAFTKKKWVAVNGVWDNGVGEAETRDGLFSAVPGMKSKAPNPRGGFFDESTFRYWFLCPHTGPQDPGMHYWPSNDAAPPAVGFDTESGHCWNGSGKRINLIERYDAVGRSIDALISDVCPQAY
ncbi:MAG: hypothetical protein EBS76_06625 [Actinobacteria bacterium]|nr:hypothetical protein [Actinomycetota bacterium]